MMLYTMTKLIPSDSDDDSSASDSDTGTPQADKPAARRRRKKSNGYKVAKAISAAFGGGGDTGTQMAKVGAATLSQTRSLGTPLVRQKGGTGRITLGIVRDIGEMDPAAKIALVLPVS